MIIETVFYEPREPSKELRSSMGPLMALHRDFHDILGVWLPDGLALSGGSQDGAWQAGFLAGIAEELTDQLVTARTAGRQLRYESNWTPSEEVDLYLQRLWWRLSGVSVGSINASALAQGWTPAKLCQLWLSIDTPNVLKSWPLGWLWGWFKGGLRNPQPLRKLLSKKLDGEFVEGSKKRLAVGAVGLGAGRYVAEHFGAGCSRSDLDSSLVDWVMASCAHPLIMPAVPLVRGGHTDWYTDGGVVNKTPTRDVIEIGGENVLALTASPPPKAITPYKKPPRLLKRSLREFEIILSEAHRDDLEQSARLPAGMRAHVRAVQPESSLPSELMNFDPKQSARLIRLGRAAGRGWVRSMPTSQEATRVS